MVGALHHVIDKQVRTLWCIEDPPVLLLARSIVSHYDVKEKVGKDAVCQWSDVKLNISCFPIAKKSWIFLTGYIYTYGAPLWCRIQYVRGRRRAFVLCRALTTAYVFGSVQIHYPVTSYCKTSGHFIHPSFLSYSLYIVFIRKVSSAISHVVLFFIDHLCLIYAFCEFIIKRSTQ